MLWDPEDAWQQATCPAAPVEGAPLRGQMPRAGMSSGCHSPQTAGQLPGGPLGHTWKFLQVKAVLFKNQGPPPIWGKMPAFPLSCQTQCQGTHCDGGGGGAGPSGAGTEADAGAEPDMRGHVRGHEVHREEATSALFRAPSPGPNTVRAFGSIQKWGSDCEATGVAAVQGRG